MFAPNPLFSKKVEIFWAFSLFFLIFLVHLAFSYKNYQEFKEQKYHNLSGVLVNEFERVSKKGKPYKVLHIKTDDFLIYSTSYAKEFKAREKEKLNFTIVSDGVSFKSFLSKRFYAPSFRHTPLHEVELNLNEKLYRAISAQHQTSQKVQNLFTALFLGDSSKKELREDITHWGVAHLVAISGFHLGVIVGVGYFLLAPIYKFFQSRFFPYRNRTVDLTLFLLTLVFFYAWVIGFIPSFLRSFVMAVFVFFLFIKNVKVVSFGVLAICGAFLIALFPSLIFNVGFIFSMLGVFYIYLYLHHFKDLFKSKLLHLVLINSWVFFGMIIPVHFWFKLITLQQLGAIGLSIIFGIFYPFMAFLHLIGQGGVIDNSLEWFLELRVFEAKEFKTPLWMLIAYLGASFASIFSRTLAIIVILLGVVPFFII
ncbi:MAG: ComEC/Rec2 family competence protein [Sulfurospirillaceae bacterium]|nr:ComEC/Rec2 family competence protein [Sulfurospirillaceae bacterium]MCK9546109.1 ComEC/Rec2 family competence protein [Sulfurospirillaceae bacterium]